MNVVLLVGLMTGFVFASPVEAVEAVEPGQTADAPVVDPLQDSLDSLTVLAEQGFAREGTARVLRALEQHADHPDAPQARLTLSRFQRDLGQLYEEDLILAYGLKSERWAPWFELAQIDAALQREDFLALADAVDHRTEFPSQSADALHFYGAWGRAGIGDERGAQKLLAKVRGPLQPQAQAFSESMAELPLRHRKPGLAGLLSAIPGLGQLYVGKVGAGLSDAVVIGGLGVATGHFAIQEQPVWSAVFGVLAGATWVGGIEGASSGANAFNETQRTLRYAILKDAYWLQADLTDERDRPLHVHTPE